MSKPASKSLHFGFQQISDTGLDIEFEESFGDLYRPQEQAQRLADDLESYFFAPIVGRVHVKKVGSKVDARGHFTTSVRGPCDRCMLPSQIEISGDWQIFLMPDSQFSKHDKPGGKVIHGPRRDLQPSRHHSSSKAEILTDAEGEHEDVSFGAFDGRVVDLRPILREELVLELPMRFLCDEACEGLCLKCGSNLNKGACEPDCETQRILRDEGPLALALADKFQK